jgi:hypothetical protein
MTFEELKRGSEFHQVTEHPSGGFQISPANNTEECVQRFHELVEEELDHIVFEHGYEVFLTHRSTSDPKGRYDTAVIIVANED